MNTYSYFPTPQSIQFKVRKEWIDMLNLLTSSDGKEGMFGELSTDLYLSSDKCAKLYEKLSSYKKVCSAVDSIHYKRFYRAGKANFMCYYSVWIKACLLASVTGCIIIEHTD